MAGLTSGSLFNGICVFSHSASGYGIQPIWEGEIEKFPCHVFLLPKIGWCVISMEENEAKVMDWINDHFILNEIEIEDFPFFPHGKLVRDKNEETMVVFWCVIYGRVDYRLQEA